MRVFVAYVPSGRRMMCPAAGSATAPDRSRYNLNIIPEVIDMNEHGIQRDSASWQFFVRTSFAVSVIALTIGIYFLPAIAWIKGYLAMGALFAIGSSFTLAKTVRDEHEAKKLINKISEVKTERILKDFERD